MNEAAQNPFDLSSLATGADLFGREDEFAWLMNGIRDQARLLLFGAEGMGKSSVLQQAGNALAQRGEGWMIRLDLSIHRNTGDLVGVLQNASLQLQHSTQRAGGTGMLGDQGKKSTPKQSGPALAGDRFGAAGDPADLLRTLGELNAFALGRNKPLVLALDGYDQLGRLGGEHLEEALMSAIESHTAICHVLCGDEHGLRTQSSRGMKALQGGFDVQKLGALDPRAFGQWIDTRFQSAGVVTRGVGAACVDLADGNTGQTIELAHRSFSLSVQARFANQATAQNALGQAVTARKEHYTQIWGGLSAQEHTVMRSVAKSGGQGLLQADAFLRCGLHSDEQARSTIHALVEKRLLDPAGPAGVKIQSATMRQWALQAHLRIGQEQKTGGGVASKISFSLSFERSSKALKSRNLGPGRTL